MQHVPETLFAHKGRESRGASVAVATAAGIMWYSPALLQPRADDNACLGAKALGRWKSGFAVGSRTGLRVQQLVDKPQQSLQGVKLCRLSRDDVFHPTSELAACDVGVRIELHHKRPMHGQVDRLVVWPRHSPSSGGAQWRPAMPVLLGQKHNGTRGVQS
jgi:hypothetical protein